MKHLRALLLALLLAVLLAVLFLAASFFGVQAETISSAKTTIAYPVNGTFNELLAAKEVRRDVYLRSGQLLDAKPVASLPASGDLIVVAANGSTLLASLRDPIGYEPTEGQTLLKSVAADGRNILVVCGADADTTLVAAYRYAEKIGVGFDLAGDAIPDAITDLSLSGFDEVGQPLGRGAWQDVPVAHKAHRVYSAAIPPQADDFEYYLESGDTKFPVTAGSASPIYQTVVVAGEAE